MAFDIMVARSNMFYHQTMELGPPTHGRYEPLATDWSTASPRIEPPNKEAIAKARAENYHALCASHDQWIKNRLAALEEEKKTLMNTHRS